jgi:GNAT superfamily N-acetyltransferase
VSAVAIRRAGPKDAPALLRLARALARTQNDPHDRATRADLHRAWLDDDAPGLALIAEDEAGAIGYIALMPSFESGHASHGFYISDIFVVARARQQGVGSLLLAAAARVAIATGRSSLWWVAQDGNAAAHRLYRRFVTIEQPVRAFAVFGEHLTRLAARQA